MLGLEEGAEGSPGPWRHTLAAWGAAGGGSLQSGCAVGSWVTCEAKFPCCL